MARKHLVDLDMQGNKVSGLATPSLATDAATKGYIDTLLAGLNVKQNVRATTTANITLSGTQSIDGVSVVAGDRVLVKDQTTGSENGIYTVAAGAWSRATDADLAAEVSGMVVFVNEGGTQADTSWKLITDDPITLGTTSLSFGKWYGSGGTQKKAFDIGGATSNVCNHNLNTRDVIVQVRSNSSPYDVVMTDVEATDANNVTIKFATAPAANAYRVLVLG